jgi:8-hydroxy-5-deazaflavin:NADPH oxidoreductase
VGKRDASSTSRRWKAIGALDNSPTRLRRDTSDDRWCRQDAVQQYADQLAGKVVVDITNPVDTQTWDKLATPPRLSSAEEVQQLVPEGTPVVKAFNTTFAPTLVAGKVGGQQLDVLIAGDDEDAKQTVSQLASDGGLRPIDVGPLNRAQQLEQLGFLHISLQQPLDLGFSSAVKLVMP